MKSPIRNLVVSAILILLPMVSASADELIRLDRIRADEFETAGFELPREAKINIDAVGVKYKYNDDLIAYAWIIDNVTRQPVWVMKMDNTQKSRSDRVLRKISANQTLPKGKYELYYYAGTHIYGNINIQGTGDFFDFLGDVLGNKSSTEFNDLLVDCYVKLSSDDISKTEINTFDITGDLPGALIKFNKLGDSQYIQKGFSLDKPMDLRVYAIIENVSGSDSPADYGWIINAKTRVKVLELSRWNTKWAGGGSKNRVFNDHVKFDKGDYILYFVTDDSHSFPDFNVMPPYDPFNWGITVLPGTDFVASAFHEYTPPDRGEPLIDFTRARDNEYFEQPFRLTRETALHIYCLGEYGSAPREFADYGWIQDASSGKIVWEMTLRNTNHAGGSTKNRMFDGEVVLPKGDYTAYYISDDSHSYNDWNDSPPFDPNAWGIAIYPGVGFRKGDFLKLADSEITGSTDILVKMVGIRDDEHRREKFTLSKQTRVHIYAIGEGDPDELFDYGWIADKRTGRSVWEMTWRNTEPAGGARKNRLFNDDIVLDPGTYEVNYISDDSHSFNNWNAPKPRDPFNWGITISIAK